jgi:putative holliday junction resolvase
VSCVLGFDYGSRRIGAAVGNRLTRSAQALGIIANGERGPDWPKLDALCAEWKPELFLVGLPLTMDGAEQNTSRAARVFAQSLAQRSGLKFEMVDERLSSIEAGRRFAEQRKSGQARRKHAATLDSVAAQIIVESWLQAT